jgi:FGGY family of carbohydrate kinases, C-terminal domain
VGRIRGGGVERDVTFGDAAPDAHSGIDDAYHATYDRYGPQIPCAEPAGGHVTVSDVGTPPAPASAVRPRPALFRRRRPHWDGGRFTDATGWFLPLVARLNAALVLDAVARMLGVDHTELSRLALSVPAGEGGLVLAPYLKGERTPDHPDATGALHGLTPLTVEPASLARAAVEGLLCGSPTASMRFRRPAPRSGASCSSVAGRGPRRALISTVDVRQQRRWAYRRTDRRPWSRPVDEARDGRCR